MGFLYNKTAAEKSTAVRKTTICLNDRPQCATLQGGFFITLLSI